jgi:hypothetical protein
MYTFTALLMLMARYKCNSLKEYWSKYVSLISRTFLVTVVRERERFLSILRMLHFFSNEKQTKGDQLQMCMMAPDYLRRVSLFFKMCNEESLINMVLINYNTVTYAIFYFWCMQHLQNVKVPYPLQARTKYTTAAKCHI